MPAKIFHADCIVLGYTCVTAAIGLAIDKLRHK